MGRTYAGVLGSLAFATEVARGLIHTAGLESTMATAITALVVFVVIGAIVGSLGSYIVTDSLRSTLSSAASDEQIKTATQAAA